MRSFLRIIVLLLPLLAMTVLPAEAAKSKGRSKTKSTAKARNRGETVSSLGQEILTSLQSFYPVTATEMGIHEYDNRLADYSEKSVKAMVSRLKGYQGKLNRMRNSSFGLDDWANYRLLSSNVDMALLHLDKIAWYRKSPQLYVDDAINGIYFLLLSHHDSMAGKLPAMLSRMRAVPTLFATAQANIHRPPKVFVQAASESLESGLEFYRQVAADLQKEFPSRAAEISAASTSAREAMNDFLDWLKSVELGDDRSFSIGRENFDYLLQHEYFLTMNADSLQRVGEALLAEANKAYTDYEAEVERSHQNGQDSVFIPKTFTRADILDYYGWEVGQVKAFLRMNRLITVPDDIAEVKVVETPPYLRTMISGIAYQPAGPFDKQQMGYFYVRPVPDSLDRQQLDARYRYVHRRGFRGSVVHEAYPGHHLQMQLAGRNIDPIRKWQRNNMLIEGWALYCEEMTYKAGLFGAENPAQWLGVLGGIRFRAARIVADVKLHTGQWSYDDCVDWMIKSLNVDTEAGEEYIRREVLRYTLTPGVQMSYLMGKREIERLKQAAQARDGSNFSEQKFYDKLLSEGSIPPALMWDIMKLGTTEVRSEVIR